MATQTPARKKNTGESGNGGEFAGRRRQESAVTLTGPAPVTAAEAEVEAAANGFRGLEPGSVDYIVAYRRQLMAAEKLYEAREAEHPSSKAQVKRDTEARRQQHGRQATIDWARDKARVEVEDQLIATSNQLDAEHGANAKPLTEREERIEAVALAAGVKEGYRDGADDFKSTALEAVDNQIDRMRNKLLDGDLSAIEVLELVRAAMLERPVDFDAL
jgi:hypothetical protein